MQGVCKASPAHQPRTGEQPWIPNFMFGSPGLGDVLSHEHVGSIESLSIWNQLRSRVANEEEVPPLSLRLGSGKSSACCLPPAEPEGLHCVEKVFVVDSLPQLQWKPLHPCYGPKPRS